MLIPVAALAAYVVMILACGSSDDAIRAIPIGGSDDSGADHAMYTDSLVNSYYDMAARKHTSVAKPDIPEPAITSYVDSKNKV